METKDTTVAASGDNAELGATSEQPNGPDLKALLALADRVQKGELIEVTRYQGLQGTLAKEQTAKQTAQQEAEAVRQQLAAEAQAKASLEAQISELSAFKQKAEPELTVKEQKLVRLNLLINEFPGLAEFEKESLLPVGSTEEELRTKFTAFQTKISGLRQQQDKQFRAGSVPEGSTTPTGQAGTSLPEGVSVIAAMEREAWDLAFHGKQKEYDAKRAEIDALKAKQGK